MSIDKRFKIVFRELEKGHILIRKKLNSIASEKGQDLDEYLNEELQTFEPWRFALNDELGSITSNFDQEKRQAHQNFIRETEYYNIVQEAPFYWRIMNKPNGYAGDAVMMSYIYRNQFEGETPFGMFLHKHAVSTKACQAVRNRKLYLTQQIIRRNGGNILSLAAGPAQEMVDVISKCRENGYKFLALDHDMDTLKKFDFSDQDSRFRYALANAFQIISGIYLTARPRKLMERFCHPRKDFKGMNFLMGLINYDLVYLKKEEFDLVYSSGLFDYIKTFPLDDAKGTTALTKNLFQLIKPGGSLIIGNFSKNNPKDLRFIMEYVYDWQLIHRDKEDIFEFARAIPKEDIDSMHIVEDPLKINYFLKINKKLKKSEPSPVVI
jgi:extracellular factor (EF) 3-hydroxypalmitic acid methyl ester biosynthesis protein